MHWNNHFSLEGKHAFLSASYYHWLNYDLEKLEARFESSMDAALGTRLHNLAKELILLGQKLPANGKTLNRYVNDAIGYRMDPEILLYYSDRAFGTADAIKFSKNLLRVHDLKNGATKCSMNQLKIYDAFFCLEYKHRPHDITIENRIYQNDDVQIEIADPDEILHIMDKIKTYDRHLMELEKVALR